MARIASRLCSGDGAAKQHKSDGSFGSSSGSSGTCDGELGATTSMCGEQDANSIKENLNGKLRESGCESIGHEGMKGGLSQDH